MAAARLARNRARTTSGWPGKATAVATSTTGLMAGADSRKASAAGAGAPCATSRPAIGTDPHSHPGRATPAPPRRRHGQRRAAGAAAAAAGRPGRRRRRAALTRHAEHQERHRLDGDGHEHRRPVGDGRPGRAGPRAAGGRAPQPGRTTPATTATPTSSGGRDVPRRAPSRRAAGPPGSRRRRLATMAGERSEHRPDRRRTGRGLRLPTAGRSPVGHASLRPDEARCRTRHDPEERRGTMARSRRRWIAQAAVAALALGVVLTAPLASSDGAPAGRRHDLGRPLALRPGGGQLRRRRPSRKRRRPTSTSSRSTTCTATSRRPGTTSTASSRAAPPTSPRP